MSAPNAAISPLIKVIIWSPPYLQNDCWQSLDLLINGNELVCTVHHIKINNFISLRLPVGLLWSLASGGGTRGSRRTRLSRMRWGLLDFSYSFLSFCTSDENQTLMEDMISTQTNFFPWPKSWPDELKNTNPTSSKMDLLPSTAPTWPRCSPSGTPRRPPPPPRLTEKTWQVSEK